MNQYEIDAGDMLSTALLDCSEAQQFDVVVKLLAGILAKRDEDVRALWKELQSARPASLTELLPFNPITGTTCLCGSQDKTQQLYYKAEDVRALVAGLAPAPLADAELQELADMEQQATPAPWTARVGHGKIFFSEAEENGSGSYSPANLQLFAAEDYDREDLDTELEGFNIQPGTAEDDAAFVAAMRNALPGLLARLATAESKLTTIRAMATRSVPQCINLEAIDRVLATPAVKAGGKDKSEWDATSDTCHKCGATDWTAKNTLGCTSCPEWQEGGQDA